jgi:hypothetical protein
MRRLERAMRCGVLCVTVLAVILAASGQGRGSVLPAAGSPPVERELRYSLTLRGRLVVDGTPGAVDFTRLYIYVWRVEDDRLRELIDVGRARDTLPPPVRPTAEGSFEIPDLAPGAYRIRVNALPRGWVARSAMMAAKDVLETAIEVRSDVTALPELVVTLSNRLTSLSGTLTVEGEAPATSYVVVVFPADRALWQAPSRRIKSAGVGADGRYNVRGLPAGAYLVAVSAPVKQSELETPSVLETLAKTAVKVTLVDGEETTRDLRAGRQLP